MSKNEPQLSIENTKGTNEIEQSLVNEADRPSQNTVNMTTLANSDDKNDNNKHDAVEGLLLLQELSTTAEENKIDQKLDTHLPFDIAKQPDLVQEMDLEQQWKNKPLKVTKP